MTKKSETSPYHKVFSLFQYLLTVWAWLNESDKEMDRWRLYTRYVWEQRLHFTTVKTNK